MEVRQDNKLSLNMPNEVYMGNYEGLQKNQYSNGFEGKIGEDDRANILKLLFEEQELINNLFIQQHFISL